MRILLIDNKKGQIRRLKKLLEEAIADCLVIAKPTVLEGLTDIRNTKIEMVVLGGNLQEAKAVDVLQLIVRTRGDIGVVVISKDKEPEFAVSAQTADDYCCVDFITGDALESTLAMTVKEVHKRSILVGEINNLKEQLAQAFINEKMSDIALNSNHKINNPLMTILGNTQLLLRDCSDCDSKTIARLEKIEKAAKKIQEITLNLANCIGVKATVDEPAIVGR